MSRPGAQARTALQSAFEFEPIGTGTATGTAAGIAAGTSAETAMAEPAAILPDPEIGPEMAGSVSGLGLGPVSGPVSGSESGSALATDSPFSGKVRGQSDLMAYPFFALSKTPSRQEIHFAEAEVELRVRPSGRGLATIYDKEILIYLASLAMDRLNRGEEFSGVLTFTAYDFFKLAGLSGASGKNYQRLSGALERLQGTQIRTSIETGGVSVEGWFSWISEAQIVYSRTARGEKRARAIRVRLTDWLVRAIVADRSVLSYDRSYFTLNAVERRLYEIARSGCAGPVARGDAPAERAGFVLDLATLRGRVGVTSPLKKFRQLLAQIVARDDLPGYRVAFLDPPGERRPLARLRIAMAPRPIAGLAANTQMLDAPAAPAARPDAGEVSM
ncbi:MAG: replication initiator protein A [Pseudomonadota bacterium]